LIVFKPALKRTVRRIPFLGAMAMKLYLQIAKRKFRGSEVFWNKRYKTGSKSGPGSYGKLAQFKADVINDFVEKEGISSVIEYGCGDGNQLKLARYPKYLGFDVSNAAVEQCRREFADDRIKDFLLVKEYSGQVADLTLSLDVIYHLVEDDVFEDYMVRLFQSARRYVIIYSSNFNEQASIRCPHVRHREFFQWIEEKLQELELLKHIPNRYPMVNNSEEGSFCDFYIWKKI
jgi:SAM-dependent methyltransferase